MYLFVYIEIKMNIIKTKSINAVLTLNLNIFDKELKKKLKYD